jgi:hypothetical protein
MKRFQKMVFTGACTAPNTIVGLKSGLDPDQFVTSGSFYLGNVFYNGQPSTLRDLKGTAPPGLATGKITNVGLALDFQTAFGATSIGDDFWVDKISFGYTPARQGRTQR